MAHDIDTTTGAPAIAYVGDTPWHSLGTPMQPGRSLVEWRKEAHLDYTVIATDVQYETFNGTTRKMPSRKVLYRSDTGAPFSVVSDRYKVVQPKEVLEFFAKLIANNGFEMETAGALAKGRRIWALAKAGKGEAVIGQDEVRPYLLLATSYDGTMATVAKPTTVRVVCQNTLAMSIGMDGFGGEADTETDKRVIVPHFRTFNADDVHLELGLVRGEFERFMMAARKLAKKRINDAFAVEFLKQLLPQAVTTKTVGGQKIVEPKPVEKTKGFEQIMALFHGEAMGSGLPEAGSTAWGLLNAVTQHVDWQRGRTDDTRMSSAWFGEGESLKNRARDLLVEVVS